MGQILIFLSISIWGFSIDDRIIYRLIDCAQLWKSRSSRSRLIWIGSMCALTRLYNKFSMWLWSVHKAAQQQQQQQLNKSGGKIVTSYNRDIYRFFFGVCCVYFVVNIRQSATKCCILCVCVCAGSPTKLPQGVHFPSLPREKTHTFSTQFICQWSCRQCTRLPREFSSTLAVIFRFPVYDLYFFSPSAFLIIIWVFFCFWLQNASYNNLLHKVWL